MPSDHKQSELRAIVYARCSSDHQREASIEDQVRECRAFIERQGWVYPHAYVDRVLSGASTVRPGYQRMLAGVPPSAATSGTSGATGSRRRCSMRAGQPHEPRAAPGVLRRVRARDQSGARR
jgi:Resolvase, N terminal domain